MGSPAMSYAYVMRLGALAAVYVVTAKLGLMINAKAGFAALVWPPTGIALTALLIFGYRLWPGVFFGALLVNVWTGASPSVALGIAIGNTCEALLGAYALQRIPGFRRSLERLPDVLGLIVLAGGLSTLVSATIGTLSLLLGGVVSMGDLRQTWGAWYLGDFIANLVVAPLLLTWTHVRGWPHAWRIVEAVGLAAALAVTSLPVFNVVGSIAPFQRAYLFFPCFVWAAVRFGQRGTATTVFAVTVTVIWGTWLGRGPFALPDPHESLFALQVFIAVTAGTFLVLSAVIAERRRAVDDLRASGGELESRVQQRTATLADANVALQRREVQLSEAQAKFEGLLESAPDGMVIVDANGRIVLVNAQTERLFGYDRVELIGQRVEILVPDSSRARHQGHRAGYVHGPQVRAMGSGLELHGRRKDGSEFPVEISLSPMQTEAGLLVSSAIRDVTDRKKVEKALREAHDALEGRVQERTAELARVNEELADAVAARDTFISIASHELRTPINALALQAELTQRGRGLNAEVVVRQVQRLTKLVDNLLDVSRISAGRFGLERETVDLARVAREAVALFQEKALKAKSALTIQADTPVVGWWDPVRLDQIIANLVSNAITYGAGRPIEVMVEGGSEAARIVVRDHGIGLAPADQQRIFERFERVGSSHHHTGLGLGLWIVRQIVEAHGGTISVESQVGAGATFTVELPLGRVDSAHRPDAVGATTQPDAQRLGEVLVVEDDRDTQESMSEALRSAGYTVASAGNGQEALNYLRHSRPPSVILLDLMMPVMDGEHFLAARDQSPELSPIPVLLLSAKSDLEQKARDLSVAGYMKKPIDIEKLLAKVRECADSQAR